MGRGPGRPKTPVQRGQLLAVARRAFAEKGYAGASLSAIAAAGGLRKSSLLHHFGSKDRLYAEVLADVLGDLQQLLPSPDRVWDEALDALGADVTDYLAQNPEAARLLVRELAGGPMPDSVGVQAVEGALRGTAWFLERGMDEGHAPRQDPMQLAMSIIGLHLIWFAAADVSAIAAGSDVFTAEAVDLRKAAIREQVRRLVGLPVP